MARKVYLDVTVRLVINADEGQSIDDVFSNMDCDFTANDCDADIEDAQITNWTIVDSK